MIEPRSELRTLLDIFIDNVGRIMLDEYKQHYRETYRKQIGEWVNKNRQEDEPKYIVPETDREIIHSVDIPELLSLIKHRKNHLHNVLKEYYGNLKSYRNNWAHNARAIKLDEAQQAAEDMLSIFQRLKLDTAQIVEIGERVYVEIKKNQDAVFADAIRLRLAIDILTIEQYEVLKEARGKRRIRVGGCAGSGKTLLAAEHGLRLSRAGLNTLILCHNPNLVSYLRDLVHNELDVFDFTSWIYSILGQNVELAGWMHYVEPTEDEINRAFDQLTNTTQKYQAIIVDEGQDFRDEWWLTVEAAFENTNGILFIFHDDNQSLLPSRSNYPSTDIQLKLSRNCRNASKIFRVLKGFYDQKQETHQRLQGGFVTVHSYQANNYQEYLSRALTELMQSYDEEDIVVLTLEHPPLQNSVLANLVIEIQPPKPRWTWQRGMDKVLEALWSVGVDATRKYQFRERKPLAFSPQFTPQETDLQLVEQFVKDWRRQFNLAFDEDNEESKVSWDVKENKLVLSPTPHWNRVLDFLSSGEWARTLPLPDPKISVQPFFETQNTNQQYIRLYDIASFKGLESDSVVLFLPHESPEFFSNIYVGLSRAKTALHIVVAEHLYPRLPQLNYASS